MKIDTLINILITKSDTFPQALEEFLANDGDINEKNSLGLTLLMQAATDGNDPIVELLLINHADTESHDPNGLSALIMASHNFHMHTANLLIHYGAQVEEALTQSFFIVNRPYIYESLHRAGRLIPVPNIPYNETIDKEVNDYNRPLQAFNQTLGAELGAIHHILPLHIAHIIHDHCAQGLEAKNTFQQAFDQGSQTSSNPTSAKLKLSCKH